MLRIKREFTKKGNYDKIRIKRSGRMLRTNSIQRSALDYPFSFINYFLQFS